MLLGRANDLEGHAVIQGEFPKIAFSFEDSPDEVGKSRTERQDAKQEELEGVVDGVLVFYQIPTKSPRSKQQADGCVDAANPFCPAVVFAADRDNTFFDLQLFDPVPEASRNELVEGKEKRRDENQCKVHDLIRPELNFGDHRCR